MDKYYPDGDKTSSFTVYGYARRADDGAGAQAVRRRPHARERDEAGREPEGLQLDVLLPGIKINTSRHDFYPIEQMQMQRFNGERWELFGPVLTGRVEG